MICKIIITEVLVESPNLALIISAFTKSYTTKKMVSVIKTYSLKINIWVNQSAGY